VKSHSSTPHRHGDADAGARHTPFNGSFKQTTATIRWCRLPILRSTRQPPVRNVQSVMQRAASQSIAAIHRSALCPGIQPADTGAGAFVLTRAPSNRVRQIKRQTRNKWRKTAKDGNAPAWLGSDRQHPLAQKDDEGTRRMRHTGKTTTLILLQLPCSWQAQGSRSLSSVPLGQLPS
jgi:hypothetical protein